MPSYGLKMTAPKTPAGMKRRAHAPMKNAASAMPKRGKALMPPKQTMPKLPVRLK